jgi:hypothetical protein
MTSMPTAWRDLVDEGAHHVEGDVGLEQRRRTSRSATSIGLGQRPAASGGRGAAEPFRQRVEHRFLPSPFGHCRV